MITQPEAPSSNTGVVQVQLMGETHPPRVEGVREGVVLEVGHRPGINVGIPAHTAREVCGVVVRSEDAAEALVEKVSCAVSCRVDVAATTTTTTTTTNTTITTTTTTTTTNNNNDIIIIIITTLTPT